MRRYVKPDYRGAFPLGNPDWDCFALTEIRETRQRERERRVKEAARARARR